MRQWQDAQELDRTSKPCIVQMIETIEITTTLINAKRLVLKARAVTFASSHGTSQVQRRRRRHQPSIYPVTAVAASRKDSHHTRLQHDETHSRARAQLALIPEPAQRART